MYYSFVPLGTLMLWLLLLGSFFSSSLSFYCQHIAKTVVVDHSGKGNFKTIQDAIDSVPTDNNAWIKIHIKAGKYLEKVKIDDRQGCIFLEGEGREKTIISWNDHVNTASSATFTVEADNFVAKGISFVNSYNLKQKILWKTYNKDNVAPAVAALVRGDKNAFYDCGFLGYQDTIEDESGRHYYSYSYIEGAVDFIFGSGQSFFDHCTIKATGYGYIAAQGRDLKNGAGGFVFNRCSIVGNSKTYLGRAYRRYSRVIYHSCTINANVAPKGWDAWQQVGHEKDFEFVEAGCSGSHYDASKRPRWVKVIKSVSLPASYSRDEFINHDGWIQNYPMSSYAKMMNKAYDTGVSLNVKLHVRF